MTSGRTLEWKLESREHFHCRGKLGFMIMEVGRDRALSRWWECVNVNKLKETFAKKLHFMTDTALEDRLFNLEDGGIQCVCTAHNVPLWREVHQQ